MKRLLTNKDGFRLAHEELVTLREKNLVNLAIANDIANLVSSNKSLSPTKTTASAAYKFWNFIALAVFLLGIYKGVTDSIWFIFLGLIASGVIGSSNKKGNSENLLDAAIIDKEFYEKVLLLKGWMYHFDEEKISQVEELIGTIAKKVDFISDFANQFSKLDMLSFWDAALLCHPKAKIQEALLDEINATTDVARKEHLKIALLYTCQFIKDLGAPIQLSLNNQLEKINPQDWTEDELKDFAKRYVESEPENNDEKFSKLIKESEAEYAHLTRKLN